MIYSDLYLQILCVAVKVKAISFDDSGEIFVYFIMKIELINVTKIATYSEILPILGSSSFVQSTYT